MAPALAARAGAHGSDSDGLAAAGLQQFAVVLQDFKHACAHSTEACYSKAERIGHAFKNPSDLVALMAVVLRFGKEALALRAGAIKLAGEPRSLRP